MKWLLPIALLLGGCAHSNPDTASDIGDGIGNTMGVLAEAVLGTVLGPVDEARKVAHARKAARDDARAEQSAEARRWELCSMNPCLYADRCLGWFPDDFVAPRCAQPGLQPPAPAAEASKIFIVPRGGDGMDEEEISVGVRRALDWCNMNAKASAQDMCLVNRLMEK